MPNGIPVLIGFVFHLTRRFFLSSFFLISNSNCRSAGEGWHFSTSVNWYSPLDPVVVISNHPFIAMRRRQMRRAVTLAAIVFACSNVTLAQSPNATVSGRVTDPAKSIISNVAIFVVNSGTGIIYKGQTNETGSYFVTDLPPGTYRMELEKPGFKTVIKPDILLHVQDALEVNFEMALGSVSQTVTVEAGAPSVQLTTSSISDVVTSTTVRELPLNGRSWTDLATLQPGVNTIQTQPTFATGADRGNRGFGQPMSIS